MKLLKRLNILPLTILLLLISFAYTPPAWAGSNNECSIQIPAPLFKDQPSQLLNYQAVQSAHEMRETGVTREGVKFSIFRGGCLEYGEIFVFQFNPDKRSLNDVSFWLTRSARVLEGVGNASKNSHLQDRAEELLKAAKKLNGSSQKFVSLGKEKAELVIETGKDGRPKIQITIGDGF